MKTKRLLGAILFLVTAISMTVLPIPDSAMTPGAITAIAKVETSNMGEITYINQGSTIVITGCDKNATQVVIPDTIEGLPVTQVTELTFQQCSQLESVTLPAALEKLEPNLFADCSKLREIHIPPALTNLSRAAFEGCPWWDAQLKKNEFVIVNGVLLAASQESDGARMIPEGVTKIADYAFSYDWNLTAVQFPSTLREIGDSAFICTSLTEAAFPEGMTTIGNDAFRDCGKLNDVTFSSSLFKIGSFAFLSTPWLIAQQAKSSFVVVNGILIDTNAAKGDVTIPDNVTAISGGVLCNSEITSLIVPDSVTYIGDYFCSGCEYLQSVTLPKHLTSISAYSFAGCTSLTSVMIPEHVTVIGVYAFSGCTGLTHVSIPGSVHEMVYAFSGCKKLTSVTIGEGVANMTGSLTGCTSLTSVRIPASVTDMTEALTGCSALEMISVDPGNTSYQTIQNVLYTKDGSTLLFYPQAKPDSSFSVPDTVTEIAEGAFQNAKNLTSVTLPVYMTAIGYDAFLKCSSLKQLTIPEGVKELNRIIYGCSSLEMLTLPKSLTKIGTGTINRADLKDIYYAGSILDWSMVEIGEGNNSLYQATVHFGSKDISVHQKATLYTALSSKIVPVENASFQIRTTSEKAAFKIIVGNAAEVSASGLVKPTKNYGETIIQVTDGDQISFLHVITEDYTPIYADAEITAFLDETITDDMTALEKLQAIGNLPASMDYDYDHWTYTEMIAYHTGNCAGSATMLVEMCRRLGIKAWVRNGARDPDAGSAHVNALAEVDGVYYELEAGYNSKAPRPYTVTKRTSLCKYKDAADGIDVYQYDGISEAETALELPDTIDGKTVTRIGDDFLKENPWIESVTIPDTVSEISESAFPDYQGILYGAKGSAAARFAAAHGIAFRVTGGLDPGDVNADLEVDILDVIAVNKYLLGASTLNGSETAAADVDADGKITSTDSLMILKYVVKLIDAFA